MIKFSSPLTIQYILISDTASYTDNIFYVNSFNLLRTFPIELIQLENSVQHFEFCFRYKTIKSYELFSFPSDFFNIEVETVIENIESYSKSFGVQSLIKVFIIDASLKNHDSIANTLKLLKHSYYILIGNSDVNIHYELTNNFTDTKRFIELLNRDLSLIRDSLTDFYVGESELANLDLKLLINPNRTFLNQNDIPGSILAWNNYYVLNQVIGNVWLEMNIDLGDKITEPNNRTNELVEQCEKIDSIYTILYNHVGIKPTDPFQPIYPSLVLIQPYHYPKIENLIGKKNFSPKDKLRLKVQISEQNLSYQHLLPEGIQIKLPEEEITAMMHLNSLRLMYLDNVAYLHSMFTYSPVLRLPQIGKSINRELSHLEKITPNKSSTISNIEKFGKKLSQLTLDENLSKYIKERNGQIFVISDLPLEWLYLNNYPLSLTHDVCRIPEFNLNSLVNNAINLQRHLYQIPKDLINQTLVIHCASKNDLIMKNMFALIDGYKGRLGFISVHCSTIDELSQAVKKYQPQLLIFDCHGSSDKDDLSSYLVIDGENKVVLTGNDIVKYGISAPLVILSACETFPNYGYVKLLSDAFMQAGAYSVTTTFLSIKITDAATIIIRILNNLHQLKTNSYHMNWLNFLSHILRSSLIFETINKSRRHLNQSIANEEISTIVTKSMRFELRMEALNDLDNLIRERSKKEISFNELEHEWLSYSIIGRADLIYFENWLENFRSINI